MAEGPGDATGQAKLGLGVINEQVVRIPFHSTPRILSLVFHM